MHPLHAPIAKNSDIRLSLHIDRLVYVVRRNQLNSRKIYHASRPATSLAGYKEIWQSQMKTSLKLPEDLLSVDHLNGCQCNLIMRVT